MFRCRHWAGAGVVLATTLLLAPPELALAQPQRQFPAQTLRGSLVFGPYPKILLNGRPAELSPGTRVRDEGNVIVQTSGLEGKRFLVHYTVELGAERVRDVWILRPEEAATQPWPTTLHEAQTWTFDSATQAWTKP